VRRKITSHGCFGSCAMTKRKKKKKKKKRFAAFEGGSGRSNAEQLIDELTFCGLVSVSHRVLRRHLSCDGS